MRIGVLEFLTGGGSGELGLSGSEIQTLASEGLGMLRAVASDLHSCGHEVFTLIDQSIFVDSPPSIQIIPGANIEPLESTPGWLSNWSSLSQSVDLVLPIAPEIGQTLQRIEKAFRDLHLNVQLSSPAFLDLASDKLATSQHPALRPIQPPTWTCSDFRESTEGEIREILRDFSTRPTTGWVIKSRFGAGCDYVVRHPDLASTRAAIDACSLKSTFAPVTQDFDSCLLKDRIVQPWFAGRHCSLSVIVTKEGKVDLVGMLEQRISGDEQVHYFGAKGPLFEEYREALQDWCIHLFSNLPPALGWIGLDILLMPPSGLMLQSESQTEWWTYPSPKDFLDHVVLIEINPRLTTSYLGFRNTYGPKLSEGLMSISGAWIGNRISGQPIDLLVIP